MGRVGPLVFIGGLVALTFALVLATSRLKLSFSNLDLIPTSPVDVTGSAKDLEPRIPDVFNVDNRPRRANAK